MQRWIAAAAMAALMVMMTGCATTRLGGKSCDGCKTSACSNGACGDSACGGLLGKLMGGGNCNSCGAGQCRAGSLGWQQGGLDYSSHLKPGFLGHGVRHQQQVVNPGPQSGTVAYPYYTHRGPRDFLLSNPPSIGR
ncbi:MAG: hypothetical protein AAFP69_06160 [Planctomycetota bacterium]